MVEPHDKGRLVDWLLDSVRTCCALVDDLSDEQWTVPQWDIVNPLAWEIGHVAWFIERWTLRHLYDQEPVLERADEFYNSSDVAHDDRWILDLPDRKGALLYLNSVCDRLSDTLHKQRSVNANEIYHVYLVIFHADMHAEAFAYSRQTLAYPRPRRFLKGRALEGDSISAESLGVPRDLKFKGGVFRLGGSTANAPFVFDNEMGGHDVEVGPFAMRDMAETQGEFRAFFEDGGYAKSEFWSEDGWRWVQGGSVEGPLYWRKADGTIQQRVYDEWVGLRDQDPMVHVNWFEAMAYCRYAKRRLPTEAEWEFAGSQEPGFKRSYPADRAGNSSENLDFVHEGVVSVGSLEGTRPAQMMGNVWEWTSSTFLPYPGFVKGSYEDYSAPWFGTRKVLKGGSWATRSRMVHAGFRNFFTPERRDIIAGFRTCPLDAATS